MVPQQLPLSSDLQGDAPREDGDKNNKHQGPSDDGGMLLRSKNDRLTRTLLVRVSDSLFLSISLFIESIKSLFKTSGGSCVVQPFVSPTFNQETQDEAGSPPTTSIRTLLQGQAFEQDECIEELESMMRLLTGIGNSRYVADSTEVSSDLGWSSCCFLKDGADDDSSAYTFDDDDSILPDSLCAGYFEKRGVKRAQHTPPVVVVHAHAPQEDLTATEVTVQKLNDYHEKLCGDHKTPPPAFVVPTDDSPRPSDE